MTNEDLITELLYEAEELKLRDYVLELGKSILEKNPRMERYEAYKLALDNAKLHSGIFFIK